ncbi:hypothetical protein VXS06_18950 [Photobacterium toruni]|uniref:Uncharacterized protein n=1 Tax=Photobacterium toruni TaxID=1935446 RepID=A0ABU6LBC2_9GAMM|nr:hypothetical protein [Photobacterium toruni]
MNISHWNTPWVDVDDLILTSFADTIKHKFAAEQYVRMMQS